MRTVNWTSVSTLLPAFSVVRPRRYTPCGGILQLLSNMEVHPTIQKVVGWDRDQWVICESRREEMVEVAGIEPAAESISIQATTGLAQVLLDSQCLLGVTSLSLGGWKFK